MKNPVDLRGKPVCPICSRTFAVAEAVVREADSMVHIECAGARLAVPGSEDLPGSEDRTD